MSICMPKNKIREYKLESQARILLNDIRVIKHRSRTEGGTHMIHLRDYDYVIKSTTKNINQVKKVDFGSDIRLVDKLMKEISFNSNGSPINPGTITIEDPVIKKSHKITIVPLTGRILLKE